MPISDQLRLTSFTIVPGAQWNVSCEVARFPTGWLEALSETYYRRPEIKGHWSLPTRSLVELLIGLDAAIVHVFSDLSSDRFIVALPGADTSVLASALASRATTEVTPGGYGADWWDMCQAGDLYFRTE